MAKVEDLNGKVVWITGASSGIGKAIAQQCAALGAQVVLTDFPVLHAGMKNWKMFAKVSPIRVSIFQSLPISRMKARFVMPMNRFCNKKAGLTG